MVGLVLAHHMILVASGSLDPFTISLVVLPWTAFYYVLTTAYQEYSEPDSSHVYYASIEINLEVFNVPDAADTA